MPPPPTARPASPVDGFVRGLRTALGWVASLKITVVLFVLSGLLVFFGTLAQTGQGMWAVVDSYFYSLWVQVETRHLTRFFQIFFGGGAAPSATPETGWFPFPGGKLLGWLMFVNLTAAHVLQFVSLVDGVRKQAARTRSTAADVLLLMAKRSGIYLLHLGVIFLLVGEYLTREFAVEQQMVINEGETADHTIDTKAYELAFVDDGYSATEQRVAVLPHTRLKKAFDSKTRLSHPDLPVDVEVLRYFVNARLEDAAAGKENLATTGYGLRHIAKPVAEVAGTDTTKSRDVPAAYVKFFSKADGADLGVYLVTPMLKDQPATLAGTTFTLSLRNSHYYKPYRVELKDFTFERYVGTNKPKDFASRVRLTDAERNVDRELTIRMNEPLRHRGETFYQSDFDKETETTTVLQVVENVGADLPYWACILVGLGMTVHFMIKLITYLVRTFARRTPAPSAATATRVAGPVVPLWEKLLPAGVAAVLFAACLVAFSYPRTPTAGPLDLSELATLPVVDGGRVKPLDTVARVNLRLLTHSEEVKVGPGEKRAALRWLLDVMAAGPDAADGPGGWEVFRSENDQLNSQLGLPKREGLRYTFAELRAVERKVAELWAKAEAVPEKKRDVVQQHTAELGNHLGLYQQLAGGSAPLLLPGDTPTDWKTVGKAVREDGTTEASREKARERVKAENLQVWARAVGFVEGLGPTERELVALLFSSPDREVVRERVMKLPPERRQELLGVAEKLGELTDPDEEKAVREVLNSSTTPPQVRRLNAILNEERTAAVAASPTPAGAWLRVLAAYRDQDKGRFDAAVKEFRTLVEAKVPADKLVAAKFEEWLNRTALYYTCTVLYGVAAALALAGFVLAGLSPRWSAVARWSAFWLLVLTLVAHTFTLAARMYLMERPMVFVTNLYSSAVFIGWGAVALGLVLETASKLGVGNLLGAIIGGGTCIIAHNLAASGDTLEMMQAVLDTNFWLATHVTTVTAGYSATYFAGLIGIVYVLLNVLPEQWVLRRKIDTPGGNITLAIILIVIGVFTILFLPVGVIVLVRGLTRKGDQIQSISTDVGKLLGNLLYAVVCFATLLSFVGTVLGGIWADQSWGRFWGWDPKENGAVLIVLWNALILHARWGGMVKEKGMAVLAVGGIVVTTWSWFGTNQLGEGLHAYGFSKALATACTITWVSSIVLMVVGVLPWKWVWFGTAPPPELPPPRARRVG